MTLPLRRVLPVLLAVALLTPTLLEAATDAAVRTTRMKQVQRDLLMHERAERVEKSKRVRKALKRKGRKGIAARPPRSERDAPPRAAGLPAPMAVTGVLDVRANDPSGEGANVAQSETSVAAWGNYVVIAWNDGQGFANGTGNTQGFAYSTDGGQSFTDFGVPAAGPGNWVWTSDPVVVVNEKTGEFFFGAMFEDGTRNGVAVSRITFSGATLNAQPAVVAAAVTNVSGLIIDKPWLAADSTGTAGGSTKLYVTYTQFSATSDQINLARSANSGASWSAPIKLSALADDGAVQGSRVVTGPAGQVYATWMAIGGAGDAGLDFMRFRRSTDSGASFGPEVTAASFFTNWGSGAPGFNREFGFAFPSLAADRAPGSQRLFMTWNESLNFYDDNLGTGATVAETETNNTSGTADLFTVGDVLTGSLGIGDDQDWFRFNGNAGQTLIAFVSALDPSLDMALRLQCSDGTSRLALSAPGPGSNNLIVFTLPATGTYYLRPGVFGGSGTYTIETGFAGGVAARARDHRDVSVVTSTNGGSSWGTPVLANDSPAGFDDWLPEIAVGSGGQVYLGWYDWRSLACGNASHARLGQSANGATWGNFETLSAVATDWTSVSSNLAPNQGDYIGLFAGAGRVHLAWADGRNGNPDAYYATRQASRSVSLVSASGTPEQVTLVFHVEPDVFAVTLERRAPQDPPAAYVTLDTEFPDGSGNVAFADTAVAPGDTWVYRARFDDGSGATITTAEVTVPVPTGFQLSVDAVTPNPAVDGITVRFTLPTAAAATLELLDVTGRRLRALDVGGTFGTHVSTGLRDGLELEPGLYFVRLTQSGRSATARVTVTGNR